jgi:high-affinity K+ transport system ATPase subunit B
VICITADKKLNEFARVSKSLLNEENYVLFLFYVHSFFPMTIIVVPQTRHAPLIAGLPFFSVMLVGFLYFTLSFTFYTKALNHSSFTHRYA